MTIETPRAAKIAGVTSGPTVSVARPVLPLGSTEADYQLVFISPNPGEVIDIVPVRSRIQNLKYVKKLNDISELRFTVDVTDRIVERIINREDVICEVLRRNSPTGQFEVEKTFFIRFWDLFEEDTRRESVIFAGVSLEDLLRRRLIVPDDDPFAAAGFSTKSGSPDVVMRDYVREQAITPFTSVARAFPELYIAPFTPMSLHTTYQRRNQDNTLLEVIQDIANTSDMDFEIFRNGGVRFEFWPHFIGTDRSVTYNEHLLRPFVFFSTKRANIVTPRLTYDRRKDVTYVYVAGQGIEEDRVFVPQGSTEMTYSPYNRIESVIDSRDDETFDQMIASGVAEIQKTLGQKVLDFEIAFGQAQTRYNVDWFLGDYITAQYRDVQYDYRLREITVEVTGRGEKLTPTFEQRR